MSLPSRGKVHFVYLTDPVKGSAISSHKAAKSHAARHGHARIRRQRMNEHQHERNKHEGGSQTLPIAATDSVSSASISRSGLAEDSNASSRGNGGGTGTNREIILHFPRVSQPSILETSPFTSVSKNIYSLYGTRVNSTQQFLIHHYVSVVIPFGKRHCQKYTDSKVWKRFMFTELFPVALANPGLLSAILLAACRSLFEQDKNSRYVQLATYYKLVCLRSMSELLAIQNLHVGDSTIAQASLLAADELNLGDREVSRQHIEAANRMVAMQGGSAMLGMNGFLAAIVDTLTCALARRDPMCKL
ncbi:hypothetical protein BBK36DRAFT_1118811 [Trichoderma citrinoviride]|uniref:Uncharacterized protein n=1 Tax=Trichoderma citrinoviride TaxID=58853 RepID=A0A2T4BA54_9HYPO|nr:hypothetical protein BBK36DRAFT_1118811 [Trichoderma citrinoviride]PTB66111.1 hypothetical protein BBK36DRAFT_1118811 [Trichoderma citrinoviride]